MITEIKGNRYNFEIMVESTDTYSDFSIKAICKNTRRFSSINNLNAMLSEFDISGDDPKFDDSTWTLAEEEINHFDATARQLFSSSHFLTFLEGKLDEDRMAGEWENQLSD
jgi:hypothetical protein